MIIVINTMRNLRFHLDMYAIYMYCDLLSHPTPSFHFPSRLVGESLLSNSILALKLSSPLLH